MKQIADWYRHRPKKVKPAEPTFEEQQTLAREGAEIMHRWRQDRLATLKVQPITLEGTFISRLVPSAQGTTLVLGFAEFELRGRAYGVNLISKNPIATAAGDHGIHQFIGRRCRVTIEVLD